MNILVLGVTAGTGADVVACLQGRHVLHLADTDRFADGFSLYAAMRHVLDDQQGDVAAQVLRIVRDHAIECLFATTDAFLRTIDPIREELALIPCAVPSPPATTLAALKRQALAREYPTNGGHPAQKYLVTLVYDTAGHLMGRFAAQVLRTASDGTGLTTAGMPVHNTRLLDEAQNAVRLLGVWHGPCSLEARMSEGNPEVTFGVVAPRFNDCAALAMACGVNLPQMVCESLLLPLPLPPPPYRSDVVMVRRQTDIIHERGDACNP